MKRNIEKYALSYYLNYFKADDEIHVIVNFTRMTTTKISDMGDTLDVSIHEYTKGEEHDANKALGGMLLNEYHVNIKKNRPATNRTESQKPINHGWLI